jgi:hypothetical protein
VFSVPDSKNHCSEVSTMALAISLKFGLNWSHTDCRMELDIVRLSKWPQCCSSDKSMMKIWE